MANTQNPLPDLAALSLGKAPATAGAAAAVPDDELERFRREWKEEVARKAPAEKSDKAKGGDKPEASDARSKGKTKPIDIDPANLDADADVEVAAQLSRVRSATSTSSKASRTSPLSPKATLSRSPVKSPLAFRSAALPAVSSSSSSSAPLSTSPTKIPFRAPQVRKDRDGAIGVYARAVEAEQSGKLNDALRLYRTAFKMEDNVDKLYQRQMAKRAEAAAAAAAVQEEEAPTVEDVVDPSAPDEPEFNFRRHIQVHPDHERPENVRPGRTSKLMALLRGSETAGAAEFAAEDENLPIPIAKLPSELLEPVLAHLDVASVEAFASTCWRARVLTANAGVWRRIAQGIYRSPMVPPHLHPRDLARRHNGEWRTVLVEEERLRLDGCYISVCHYVRPGAGEEWVAVTHMITYHRFLRFYADGSVISFLTTDHPHDVVPNLNPSLRGKGLHFGRWRLVRSDEPVDDESEPEVPKDTDSTTKKDPKSKTKAAVKRARVLITDLLEPGVVEPKYEFEMDIALRETNRGKWNKLDLTRYSTINLRNGELLDFSLRHQKSFYFSKVRSWSPQL